MKKQVLLVITLVWIHLLYSNAASITQNITMMIGSSITIYPYSDVDANSRYEYYSGMNYEMYYNTVIDNSAFTITSTKYNIPNTNPNLSGNTKSYYDYTLHALKRGTYRMVVKIGYLYGATGVSDIATYNINVVDVTQINMPSKLDLQPGDTYTLTPQILETGATSELTWTSTNTGVAVVDKNGTIRVLRVGTTDITCTAYNGVSATCKLTVVPVIATEFSLEETECEVTVGESVSLNPVFTPANTTDQSVTYKSSNTKIATVDADGTVTGINTGTCNITATTADGSYLSATCAVTVKPAVTAIGLPESLSITIGENTKLNVVIEPSDARTTLKWSSSNPSVVSVSNDGSLTTKSIGRATITCAATNGVSASCEVTVNQMRNYLTCRDLTSGTGGNVTLPIELINKDAITAIQFDIILPEGVTIASTGGQYAAEKTARSSNHSLGINMNGENVYRVLLYSSASEIITGTSGAVLNIPLITSDDMMEGNYTIRISNINLTKSDESKLLPLDSSCKLVIKNFITGDANNDGIIDVTDIVTVANYILGNPSSTINVNASDFNADGSIDVTDIVGIANWILGINTKHEGTESSSIGIE